MAKNASGNTVVAVASAEARKFTGGGSELKEALTKTVLRLLLESRKERADKSKGNGPQPEAKLDLTPS